MTLEWKPRQWEGTPVIQRMINCAGARTNELPFALQFLI